MDEQVQTAPTTELDPAADRIQIDLPADMLPEPTEEQPTEAKPTETPAAPAPDTPTPAEPPEEPPAEPGKKVVPLAALQEERKKRKDVTSLYEQAEQARQQHEAELARLRAEASVPKVEPKKVAWNDLEDMEAVAKHIREEIDARVASVKADADVRLMATKAAMSEALARAMYPDYDEQIKKAGVLESLGTDPATGKLRDPFLAKWIYGSENPAQTAYDYACGKLAKTTVAEAKAQGKEEGKREVVEKLMHNATKPRGIAAIRPAPVQTGLSRADILAMSDDQKRRLFKDRPDVERWYLLG